jgi:N-acylneuraminate cytidylyltransferase
MPGVVAYVPARAGSERVPGKNLQPLAGHPLIAYALASALESELFDAVVVSTDSEEIAAVARSYGGEVPCLRPPELATGTSPDIDWVLQVTGVLEGEGRVVERFAILRPTSPFRSADTIRRADAALLALGERADSIRAVERCRQHPAKMWVLDGELMTPLLPQPEGETPLHSRQYQALPAVYAQNSSLEIAWRHVLDGPLPTISGTRVAPFLTDPVEGLSIDYPEDIGRAEQLMDSGQAKLPAVGALR